LKIINKLHQERRYELAALGLAGAELSVVGRKLSSNELPRFVVPPDSLGSFRLFVRLPRPALKGESAPLTFVLSDTESGAVATYATVFRGPAS
jgi:hypothetical protein